MGRKNKVIMTDVTLAERRYGCDSNEYKRSAQRAEESMRLCPHESPTTITAPYKGGNILAGDSVTYCLDCSLLLEVNGVRRN